MTKDFTTTGWLAIAKDAVAKLDDEQMTLESAEALKLIEGAKAALDAASRHWK